MTRRILIADANAPLREELAALLAQALAVVADQHDGPADTLAAAARGYDAVAADWPLVEGAAESLRALAGQPDSPELLVLGASESQVRALRLAVPTLGLETIEKPFRFTELAIRLREQLRRRWDAIGPRLGRFRFDPAAKLLVPDAPAEAVRLTEKEAEILDFLYRQMGAVVERETLLRALWQLEDGLATHTLETHIYRLRQKLEVDPARAMILVTEDGGYRLVTSPASDDADLDTPDDDGLGAGDSDGDGDSGDRDSGVGR